ncbi:MAG: hypothetical protein JOY82_23680 [Streptosporangiaceae bacterium]|nr:hypothetical protein [Streptosporangiaceae bacterium]
MPRIRRRERARERARGRWLWPVALDPRGVAAHLAAALAVAVTSVVVAAVIAGLLTASGSGLDAAVNRYMRVYAAQTALVMLTLSVVIGVAATERTLLRPAARVAVQIAHRIVSVLAVGFLALHITLEVVTGRAAALAVAVPFSDAGDRYLLGLGTIAADLVAAVTVTSVVRFRYAGAPNASHWRAFHMTAYLAWPVAIVHGMFDQHSPGSWAGWAYLLCVALVALAVVARQIVARRGPSRGDTGR